MASAAGRRHRDEVYTFSRETGVSRAPRVFAELDRVRLTANAQTFDDEFVAAGTQGTIVVVHGAGVAYDVEVFEPHGIVAVSASEIAPIP